MVCRWVGNISCELGVCVSWSAWGFGLRLAPVSVFETASGVLLFVPWRCFFCGSFLLFIFCVCLYYTGLSVPCSILIACCERGDLLAWVYYRRLIHITKQEGNWALGWSPENKCLHVYNIPPYIQL